MTEADRDIVKPEIMKSYVWLQTSDGSIQHIEQEVAMFCPLICHEIHSGIGSSKNYPISLPTCVNPATLSLILDYCRFHQVPGRSNKERKAFDEKFIRTDTKRLCELTSAADSLQLKPLVNLTSRALARMIEGKNPEEIREIFHLPDDLTEEEKLEPLKNTMDDPRIRLLNRLYARKRQELKERQKSKIVDVDEERVDDRSLDDLLTFINGENEDPKGDRITKNKKKNRRRKDQEKNAHSSTSSSIRSSSSYAVDSDKKEANVCSSTCQNIDVDRSLMLQEKRDDNFAPEDEFDSGYLDDEIDPAMKEKIDREVEDFARRLNSDWPGRMQELLSLGPDRKPIAIAINDNGSLSRYTRLDQEQR